MGGIGQAKKKPRNTRAVDWGARLFMLGPLTNFRLCGQTMAFSVVGEEGR